MTVIFPSNNAFFVSQAGKRIQKHLKSFLKKENIYNQPSVLIGPSALFLPAFDEKQPDIILENENLPNNILLPSLCAAGSVSFAFVAALNHSVAESCIPLIKEIHRLLKPRGHLFLIIKNTTRLCPVKIPSMPSLSVKSLRNEILNAGFLIKRQQNSLVVPYRGKLFDAIDDFLFSLKIKTGCFSLFDLEKKPFITQTKENYNSARITKASVLTSPRT